MESYWVFNKRTKKLKSVEAASKQEACQKLGWSVEDCFIQQGDKNDFIEKSL